jgi:enoyl-CoA hydratase/carnithine racemase
MSEAPAVLVEIKDSIGQITLNRPERMNTWGPDISAGVFNGLRQLAADDRVRAIVVTGSGSSFCAGADASRRRAQGETNGGAPTDAPPPRPQEPRQRVRAIYGWQIPKPVIAAINGAAAGVGLTLPLTFDIRIAALDAKLGFVFVRRGLVPELAATWILPRLIGVSRASDLLLSGRIVLGKEAAELGLVSEALPREKVLERAREIATEIAVHAAPVSVAITKRMIWESMGIGDPVLAASREQKMFEWSGTQPDTREGFRAFFEKRPPRWTARVSTDLPPGEPLP